MKTSKNICGVTNIPDVDFTSFSIQPKEIAINGKKLPLKIGDKIRLCENDPVGRTVMGITIHEDSRVQYILEWHDPTTGSFSSEALTLSELKLISKNSGRAVKSVAGFSAGEKRR